MTAKASSSPQEQHQSSRHRHRSFLRSSLVLILIGAIFPLLIVSCKPAQLRDPVSIVQAAYDRLNAGDVPGYMKFYSDDAVMIDPHGSHTGAEEIRQYIEQEVVSQQFRFELSDLKSNGNEVTYTIKLYQGTRLLDTSSDGLDVVVDGKIIFEGTETLRRFLCIKNASQAFCPQK